MVCVPLNKPIEYTPIGIKEESPPRVLRSFEIGASPSGKAQDFDSCSGGSIPSAPAITFKKNERRRDASFAKNN